MGSSQVLAAVAAVEVLAEDAKIGVKRGNSDLDMVRLILEDGLVVHGANAVEETAFKGSVMEDTTDVEGLLTGGGGDDKEFLLLLPEFSSSRVTEQRVRGSIESLVSSSVSFCSSITIFSSSESKSSASEVSVLGLRRALLLLRGRLLAMGETFTTRGLGILRLGGLLPWDAPGGDLLGRAGDCLSCWLMRTSLTACEGDSVPEAVII